MPIKPEMKSDRFAAQITSICSEWEDNVLFDEDDPDFAYSTNAISGNAVGVNSATTNGVLRPVSAAACVLNQFMLKGKCCFIGLQ